LAYLVAQEEHVDVNFIRNNNFNDSAYRNNYASNNYRPYPSTNGNGYGNSYGNSSNNTRGTPSELEVMLMDFIGKQTAFNKFVEEKLGKIDILASKVDSVTSQDFIKFWGFFFAFVLSALIENSQGFKTLSYLKALLENHFKLPKYFLKNLFEKTKYKNIIFSPDLKYMQACLQGIVLQNYFILLRVAISKL
jgi:hypothetical protein